MQMYGIVSEQRLIKWAKKGNISAKFKEAEKKADELGII